MYLRSERVCVHEWACEHLCVERETLVRKVLVFDYVEGVFPVTSGMIMWPGCYVGRTSGVRFSLSVQFPPLPTRSPQHLPFKVLRWLYFPQTLLPFSANPGMSVWLATSYINPNFSFPTAFSKSAQLVSIFSLYCKAIFHTFLNQILREYSDHPVSHQEFFLLHSTFFIFPVRWWDLDWGSINYKAENSRSRAATTRRR